jgi:hypothetical protein
MICRKLSTKRFRKQSSRHIELYSQAARIKIERESKRGQACDLCNLFYFKLRPSGNEDSKTGVRPAILQFSPVAACKLIASPDKA